MKGLVNTTLFPSGGSIAFNKYFWVIVIIFINNTNTSLLTSNRLIANDNDNNNIEVEKGASSL